MNEQPQAPSPTIPPAVKQSSIWAGAITDVAIAISATAACMHGDLSGETLCGIYALLAGVQGLQKGLGRKPGAGAALLAIVSAGAGAAGLKWM